MCRQRGSLVRPTVGIDNQKGVEEMRKVLVVDSEPGFVRVVTQILQPSYQVIFASRREEGLKRARREAPDLVLLGFLEPRGDSFKLHKELRESPETNRIPLLVVDVRPEEHSRKGWRREEGMQMDAEDYVSRPIESTELMELVEDIFQRVALKSVSLADILDRMERALKRMEKIEEMLVK